MPSTFLSPASARRACESSRKLARTLGPAAFLLWLTLGPLVVAGAATAAPAPGVPGGVQPPPAHEPGEPVPAGAQHGVADAEHPETEAHAESPWGFIGKVFNFAVLAGTLAYFLRSPIARYLRNRSEQIRVDLVTAERMKTEAAAQMAAIEQRLRELPRELDALKERGRAEIEAEEARIRAAAEAERDRLLEQARRAIDLQLRTARRDLVNHAADLAVQVARARIGQQITRDDQLRLVDRYLEQVTTHG